MTTEQMKAIESLRAKGCGYKKISMETGISIGTVKSYFHRTREQMLPHTVQPEGKDESTETKSSCRFCGKPLTQNPGRREKKFCSDSCRSLWWNRHKYTVPRKSNRIFICQACGSEFSAYGATDRKYCSHACYINGRFHSGIGCG